MNKLKIILQCILGLAPLIFSIVLPIELLWDSLGLVLDRDLSDFKKWWKNGIQKIYVYEQSSDYKFEKPHRIQ